VVHEQTAATALQFIPGDEAGGNTENQTLAPPQI